MKIERLTTMVNDMAHFFAVEPDTDKAAAAVADHLRKFWEPRMRAQIIAHVNDTGGIGLEPLALAGVRHLAAIDRTDSAA